MSRTIDPPDDSPTSDQSDGVITSAIERVEVELDTVEETLSVLEEFQQRVDSIEPSVPDGGSPAQPRVLAENSASLSAPEKVLDAFRETYGSHREYPTESRENCLELFAREFSSELAEHLEVACRQSTFPPNLKATVLAQSVDAQKRHLAARDSLREEIESLEAVLKRTIEISDRLDELEPSVGEEISFSTLIDRYEEVGGFLEQLDRLAESRQRTIHSETGGYDYQIDHSRFTKVIYTDLEWRFPALRTIASCAEECRETRHSLVMDLGLAD